MHTRSWVWLSGVDRGAGAGRVGAVRDRAGAAARGGVAEEDGAAMKPVYQTLLVERDGIGDCLRACVASILEREIKDVPFCDREPSKMMAWLQEQGFDVDIPPYLDGLPACVEFVCLFGESPRGISHAIVGQVQRRKEDNEMGYAGDVLGFRHVHDPHPSRGELRKVDGGLAFWPKFARTVG